VRADEVIDSLKELYAPPAFALLEQVGDSTGYASRHIDAIVMSLYPSRGLGLTGVEVKVSRNDWRTELRRPGKAEPIARFCDYFVIAAPKGVVPIEEVPENWGLIEISDKGKARTSKQPVRNDADPIDRRFLAAILRRAAASTPTWEMKQAAQKEAREGAEREIESRVDYQTSALRGQLEGLQKRVKAFEEKTGLPLEDLPRAINYYGFANGEDLAAAYLFLAQGGSRKLSYQLSRIDQIIERLQAARGTLKELVDDTDTLEDV
jgi:hypothetical protein